MKKKAMTQKPTSPIPNIVIPIPMPPASIMQRLERNILSSLAGSIYPRGMFGPSFYEEIERPPALDHAKLAALKAAEPHKVMQPTPDMMQIITGWRAWGVGEQNGEWRLKALGTSYIWEPKKQVDAVCNKTSPSPFEIHKPRHPAPYFECECGVWAFKDMERLLAALEKYSEVKVLGTVALWGRVIETENGYRAQHAYPSELWLMNNNMEELGYIYDVPVRTA